VLFKLVESCHKLYFDSDEERHRVIAGDILYAVSKYATDRFNSLAGDILPLVFVAKHDTYERAKTLFDDIWSENVAGTRTVLLYQGEIISLASQHLDSARWSIKHTSAFAVGDVVTSSGTGISDANAKIIWPALEKALAGKVRLFEFYLPLDIPNRVSTCFLKAFAASVVPVIVKSIHI